MTRRISGKLAEYQKGGGKWEVVVDGESSQVDEAN
jgi:hypothetical protein